MRRRLPEDDEDATRRRLREVERDLFEADAGLPPDLLRVLRDPTIRLPQDDVKLADGRSLWDHLAEWRNAPSNTASAGEGPEA